MSSELPITVGFDGSAFSFAALQRGLELANKLGARVQIVRAWSISNAPRPSGPDVGYVPSVDEFEAAVAAQLHQQIDDIVAQYPNVAVEYLTPHGAAGRELIKASEHSQLIVVGTRGSGGFAGLLLGSVTDQIVEHAKCDVLVIRLADGEQAPGRTLKLDTVMTG
ncbi:MAG: universal stress protein [Propionibacteriaceae bacterium]|jgi:nucleotide-binding universal stress UspA family protein|nr:universal stress protein [Propionibacteriaceae bacterium]